LKQLLEEVNLLSRICLIQYGKKLADRKSFALAANQSENFSILMQIYSGKNPDEFIKKKLLVAYVQKYPNKTYGET
jgi:hypothetical protein